MKFIKTIIIFTIFFKLISCEDEINGPENYFTVHLTDYEISTGIIRNYGKLLSHSEGYNFDLTLFAEEVIYESENNTFKGYGNLIHFELFSSSQLEIVEGLYTFDPERTENIFTFSRSHVNYNYNFENSTGSCPEIKQGTINIKKDNNIFIIEIDCKISNNTSVKGFYKGSLNHYSFNPLDKIKSYINFKDEIYDLDKGLKVNGGRVAVGVEVFNNDLFLYSRTITFDPSLGFKGVGNVCYFQLFSNLNGQLPSGTYEFDNSQAIPLANTFYFGVFVIDSDFNVEAVSGFQIVDGTVTIEITSDAYEISFDCITQYGENISGIYIGDLSYYYYGKDFNNISNYYKPFFSTFTIK